MKMVSEERGVVIINTLSYCLNMKKNIIHDLKRFSSPNEDEMYARDLFLSEFPVNPLFLFREGMIHLTASSWIVNKDYSKVLMVYHNIYKSWSWCGGHADGEADLLSVAIREAKEETGVDCTPVMDGIFSIEILEVKKHEKNGKIVPPHVHANVTYLLTADESATLKVKEDENSGVKWIPVGDLRKEVKEKFMYDNVYSKLIEKCERLKKQ